MAMTTEEFIIKMREIKNMGFVKSLRKGPTGIGYTLESLLGIKENALASPDLGKVELKAHRSESTSMITLFTFNRKVWKMPPLEAIKKYGSYDNNHRLGLYYTMSLKPNSHGLFLYVAEDTISVRHIDGITIAEWNLEALTEQFNHKIPSLVLVYANTEERDGNEFFFFNRAVIMHNTTKQILFNQFMNENLLVDLRLHDKVTMARNHGTGFRAKEDRLIELFANTTDLDI